MRQMNISPKQRIALLATPLLMLALSSAARQAAPAPVTSGPTEFKVGGAVKTPLVITAADMKSMPRVTVRVVNTHNNNKTEVYEGIALAPLLAKAGLPQGEQIRGPWMAAYVLVEAADGYRVIFSLAELDS